MSNKIEIQTKHFTFEGYQDGDPGHPLVLFLHGFPESAHMWIRLMRQISADGYYCVAPNMRGYSPGACPRGKKNYRIGLLVNDVIEVANTLSKKQFHLVGHDWGSAIGWKLVHDHENRIISWSALSIPHLQAFGQAIVNDPTQRKMSQYMRSFQIPWLPEFRIRSKDFLFFRKLWRNSSKEEVEAYLQIFRRRKSLTAALNYYRANYNVLVQTTSDQIVGEINVPTLFIWGEKDLAVSLAGVEKTHPFVKGPYKFIRLPVGHWLIQSAYNETSEAIITHIRTSSAK